jgi:hypothetical protein
MEEDQRLSRNLDPTSCGADRGGFEIPRRNPGAAVL